MGLWASHRYTDVLCVAQKGTCAVGKLGRKMLPHICRATHTSFSSHRYTPASQPILQMRKLRLGPGGQPGGMEVPPPALEAGPRVLGTGPGQRAWVLGICAEFVPFWALHFHFPSLREPRLPVRSTGPGVPELLLHQ